MMEFHKAVLHSVCFIIVLVNLVQDVAGEMGEEERHLKVGPPASLMRDRAHIQDRDHIKSHLQDMVDLDAIDLSTQRLQFHYFHSHDVDQNKKLDGLELMQSILHVDDGWDEMEGGHGGVMSEEKIVQIVDVILEDDDIDRDGYVDYVEFSRGLEDIAPEEEDDDMDDEYSDDEDV